MIKKILFNEDAELAILEGVQKLFASVSSTFGPSGNVVMSDEMHGVDLTKDGVSVAKKLMLGDAFHHLAAHSVREVALKTVDRVGDGTTASVVFAFQLLLNGLGIKLAEIEDQYDILKVKNKFQDRSRKKFFHAKAFKEMSQKLIGKIDKITKEASNETLLKVARTSSNGDEKIVDLISNALEFVGKDGNFIINETTNKESFVEASPGVYLPVGMTSPFFSTVPGKLVCELENPLIILSDESVKNYSQISSLINLIHNPSAEEAHLVKDDSGETRPFVFILKDISFVAEANLVANIKKLGEYFKTACVVLSSMEKKEDEYDVYEDLNVVFGGSLISPRQGLNLTSTSAKNAGRLQHLGGCKKIIISQEKTIIIPYDERVDAIKNHSQRIRELISNCTLDSEKNYHKARLAQLADGVAVINVGGATKQSMKEIRDRVEDAACAVKSSRDHGVISGACEVYDQLSYFVEDMKEDASIFPYLDHDKKNLFIDIVRDSLLNMKKILFRARNEVDLPVNIPSDDCADWKGINLHSFMNETINLWDEGIIDPAHVARETILNAFEIIGLLLNTKTMIAPDMDKIGRMQSLNMGMVG